MDAPDFNGRIMCPIPLQIESKDYGNADDMHKNGDTFSSLAKLEKNSVVYEVMC